MNYACEIHTPTQARVGTRERRTALPIADGVPAELLAEEIDSLGPTELLLKSGNYSVFLAPAQSIRLCLYEIGRLREIAFRQVGEGTGRELDLDPFDETYEHIFVWDASSRQILGGYRLTRTDVVLEQHGIDGLYTHSLFQLDANLFDRIGPALELGRSFVRPEAQRAYAPLLLLWKGIGRVIARDTRYRHLFGALSISADFSDAARDLMLSYLAAHQAGPEQRELVVARNPVTLAPEPPALTERLSAWGIDQLCSVVESLDGGDRRVPPLLRQYLRLGARVLGFSRDAAFGNVIDAFVVVDLRETPLDLLERYVGKRGASGLQAA